MKNLESEILTQENLKKLLHYNKETGIFTWKERPVEMFVHCKNSKLQCNAWNARYTGTEAGYVWKQKNRKTSYVIICITLNGKGRRHGAHRLAVLYTDGRFPPESVDHIDGNGLNNCRNNLREVNHKENHKNRPMNSNNTSGYVGVTWDKRDQKWRVSIRIDGRTISGGRFTNKEEAIEARKKLNIKYKFHKNHGRES